MIAEIRKIDLEAILFRILKIPTAKILDISVKIHFARKNFSQG